MLKIKKDRKMHKNIGQIKKFKNSNLSFGLFGIKALESGYIKKEQIEAARQGITRQIKPFGYF
jgi:large subunit ribosomal protein L16